jgi:Calcineurin-like phosphoesterase
MFWSGIFCYTFVPMKLLAIGDIHGRDVWKDINFLAFDKVVFVGDYADSYTHSDWQVYQNLKEIIDLKKQNFDKIVLLLGNHDIHYSHYPNHRCSGFREIAQYDLTELFTTHKDCFQVAYQIDNQLFTHAGISGSWYNQHYQTHFKGVPYDKIAERLNEMNDDENGQNALFQVGKLRGGKEKVGGIVWADKLETQYDYLFGLNQIVGHTRLDDFESYRDDSTQSSITYIDVLSEKEAFFEMII